MHDDLLGLLSARSGHFRLESGHHGDLWMDLELLCLRPNRVQRLAVELASRLFEYKVNVICGPMVEGAFVALMVAAELDVEFCYAERFAPSSTDALYSVEYRIPSVLRDKVQNKRVAIVNDVINAGSAVRGTYVDLEACGAETVAIGSLLVLGDWVLRFAAEREIALGSIASLPNRLWISSECPLCASGVPLDDFVH